MKPTILIAALFLTITMIGCSKTYDVEAVKAKIGTVEQTVTTINSGTVEAKLQSELAFGAVGRVSKINLQVGSIVEKNQIIAEIENSDLRAMYNEARRAHDRDRELFKSGLISSSALDSSTRVLTVARTNLDKTLILAPFKGMITALDLKIGEFYQNQAQSTSRPKVQIIDLNFRIIKGEIDEIDLPRVKLDQIARIKIPAFKNQIFKAKVSNVVPFISTAKDQDRTSEIELEIIRNETDPLIPVGASADVEIVVSTKDSALSLPTQMVLGVGNEKFVYAIIDNVLTKTPIVIGVRNYDKTEIISGLTEGMMVAKLPDGARAEDKVKVNPKEKNGTN